MKKLFIAIAGALLLFVASLIHPISSYATDWIKLPANEVISSAELIVQGRYDFIDSKQKQAKGMFTPFEFKVDRYYRGSGSTIINAGINLFDTGWVKEFQDKGGTFILFLKRDTENEGFLIPVGGPNGMVQVLNGTIQNQSTADLAIYNEFIRNQATVTPEQSEDNRNQFITFTWTWFIGGFVVLFGGITLIWWLIKKQKHV